MLYIDLNCDMGEGMETDAVIFPYISSANIACGYHAGDVNIMRQTVELALKHGVAIGAHPSYPDRENFGRVDMLVGAGEPTDKRVRITTTDLSAMITDQLDRLQNICRESGTKLHHVKPHGALYNRAAADPSVSMIICKAIREFDPSLLLYGLSGSVMGEIAAGAGIGFVSEVFSDRTYREDGSLTPRTEGGALIDNPDGVTRQVLKMVREGRVVASSGKEITLKAETICIHGDGFHAMEFAKAIHECLRQDGVAIRTPLRDGD